MSGKISIAITARGGQGGGVLADWILAGRRPTFFMHCPNNVHSPALSLWLDRLVRARIGMPALPLPEQAPAPAQAAESPQLSLI